MGPGVEDARIARHGFDQVDTGGKVETLPGATAVGALGGAGWTRGHKELERLHPRG